MIAVVIVLLVSLETIVRLFYLVFSVLEDLTVKMVEQSLEH